MLQTRSVCPFQLLGRYSLTALNALDAICRILWSSWRHKNVNTYIFVSSGIKIYDPVAKKNHVGRKKWIRVIILREQGAVIYLVFLAQQQLIPPRYSTFFLSVICSEVNDRMFSHYDFYPSSSTLQFHCSKTRYAITYFRILYKRNSDYGQWKVIRENWC